jgi:hypothetical protein
VISQSRGLRRVALVVGSAPFLLLAYAGPVSADVPEGWSDPPSVPVLRELFFFVGVPILITLCILAAVYLPGVVRGESVAPAGAHTDDQWFGGRRATGELEAAGTSSADRSREAESRDTGGASGSW